MERYVVTCMVLRVGCPIRDTKYYALLTFTALCGLSDPCRKLRNAQTAPHRILSTTIRNLTDTRVQFQHVSSNTETMATQRCSTCELPSLEIRILVWKSEVNFRIRWSGWCVTRIRKLHSKMKNHEISTCVENRILNHFLFFRAVFQIP